MDKDKASKLLHDTRACLDSLGLTCFLVDGTLLGAIRECDFIEHDLDIDIGVFAEEWDGEILENFKTKCSLNNLPIHHVFGELDKYFEIAIMRGGIKIDLFFYRREGNKRIFHAFKNGGRTLPADVITYEYQAELIENLLPISFQNEMYLAPKYAVAVLVAKYGPNWQIPDTSWNWAESPFNKI